MCGFLWANKRVNSMRVQRSKRESVERRCGMVRRRPRRNYLFLLDGSSSWADRLLRGLLDSGARQSSGVLYSPIADLERVRPGVGERVTLEV